MKNQVKTSAENGDVCLDLFYQNQQKGRWTNLFSKLLIGLPTWESARCTLTWKIRVSKFKRMYFKLLAGRQNELLPTVTTSDGTRGGELVSGKYKTRPSGVTYFSTLSDLAKSGLLPTPTTAGNRNSKNAVQKIGAAHQRHGIALGLAQVIEIASGILPKEFNAWTEVPLFYRLLPTPTVREYRGGRHPENLKAKGRKPSNSLGDAINSIAGSCTKLNPLFITEMMGFPLRWILHPFINNPLKG